MTLSRMIRLIPAAVWLAVVLTSASAQFGFIPYTSDKGLDMAAEYSATQWPSGSRLVVIGAIGEAMANGMPMRIDPATGEASVWAYIVHVPSTNSWRSLAVVNIEGMGASVFEADPPVAIPPELTGTIDLSGAYASSGAMARRLATDPTYAAFALRTGMRPSLVSLHPAGARDSAALPPGFPLDAPVWTLVFGKQDSATLYCWVSSRTGDVHVLDPRTSSATEPAERTQGSLDLAVTPNPSRSTVVAHITGGSATPPRVTLHATSGELIDTTPNVVRTTDGWRFEIDLSSCASGTYVLTTIGTEGSKTSLIRHIANGS